MGGVCDMYGGQEKFTHKILVGKPAGRGPPTCRGGIFLILMSSKYNRREWTTLNKIKHTNLSSFLVFNWHSSLMDQCTISCWCVECRYPSSTCTNPFCQCSLWTESNIHCQSSPRQYTHYVIIKGQPFERVFILYICKILLWMNSINITLIPNLISNVLSDKQTN